MADPAVPSGLLRIERALVVDAPWIDLILDGGKDWEMRTRATRVRGPVGLVRSGSGLVVGVVEVVGSLGPLSPAEMLANAERHRIPADLIESGAVAKWRHAWVLRSAARLRAPVPYRHPRGAVIWVTLDPEARAAVAAAEPVARALP